MSDFQQKPTGTQCTMTVALLILALIFSPAVLIVSRPFEYFSVSVALVSSGLCLALAWVTWKRSSQLTIPSIAPPGWEGEVIPLHASKPASLALASDQNIQKVLLGRLATSLLKQPDLFLALRSSKTLTATKVAAFSKGAFGGESENTVFS